MKLKFTKLTALTVAGLLVLSGCSTGDSDSSSKKAKEDSSSNGYEIPQAMTDAAKDYDPNGDTRIYDAMKSEFYGDYHIEMGVTVSDIETQMVFNITDAKMSADIKYENIETQAYYPGDGTFYSISVSDKTYEKYTDYSIDISNTDRLFGATKDFTEAQITDDGIKESYTLSGGFASDGGTIDFCFSPDTGELVSFDITIDDTVTSYSVQKLCKTDEESFDIPELDGYTENATYQTPIEGTESEQTDSDGKAGNS